MKRCEKHKRYNCTDPVCSKDNAGEVGVDLQGDLTVGLGGGLVVDTTDGSIGMKVGGVTIDFDGQ